MKTQTLAFALSSPHTEWRPNFVSPFPSFEQESEQPTRREGPLALPLPPFSAGSAPRSLCSVYRGRHNGPFIGPAFFGALGQPVQIKLVPRDGVDKWVSGGDSPRWSARSVF